MKSRKLFTLTILFGVFSMLILSCTSKNVTMIGEGRDQLFDYGWKFCKDSTINAQLPGFNDLSWRSIDLPHDWSIEDLPGVDSSDKAGPFIKSSIGSTATGYVLGGTAWYRKKFKVNATNKNVIISFDGVYMESDVWVNGNHVGYHPYGYTPFYYDITSYLNKPEQANVIAVKVRNYGKNSRWYSGSGIYRHVWMTIVNPIHIDIWGIYATTPIVTKDSAVVSFLVNIKNTSVHKMVATLKINLKACDGNSVARGESKITIDEKNICQLVQKVTVKNPQLWSPANAKLYKAQISICSDTNIIDQYWLNIGIRSIAFSAEKGFLLNGEMLKLKGGCMHHDNGLLGSATYDRAEERRVENMKANGFNAIRTSHNPPSKQFLDACDHLGMLVLDEAFDMWEMPKNTNDYHLFFNQWHKKDLQSMLLRDRNHPSVIFWSIGNEIEEHADSSGHRIAKQLVDIVKQYDTTRPVTEAICGFWNHPARTWDETKTAYSFLDVGGYNYQPQQYESDYKKFPKRIMMGTESVAKEAGRYWKLVEKCSWVIGDFVWTGMDYLGETGIGHSSYTDKNDKNNFIMPWPWYDSWCGDIDICGNKKPQSYYRDVVWGRSKIEMAVHEPIPAGKIENISYWGWPNELQSWNWKTLEGNTFQISVYSSCNSVRLELNGKVMGEKIIPVDSNYIVKFDLTYEPGELKAIGLSDGKEVAEKIIRTTGEAKNIRLSADRNSIHADRNELSYISVEVTDQNGNIIPDGKFPIILKISGVGELLAAGNACPNEPESFKDPKCKTFRGKALVIIRPTGKPGLINVTASSSGLTQSSIEVQAN